MKVTIDLMEEDVSFLQRMIRNESRYEHISSLEDALHECISVAKFDLNETLAAEEGM
ncbi:MAG: hypothetical protein ACOYW7_13325 [Nitrospirota bacterium]